MLTVALSTTEPDEALERCANAYFPHRLDILHDPSTFRMDLRGVHIDTVFSGILRYSGQVELTTPELEDAYQINVPLAGSLRTSIGEERLIVNPTTAAVYRPDDRTMLRGWAEGGALYGMKIPRSLLEGTLSDLVGTQTGILRLGRSLDLSSGAGRQWWMLARSLMDFAVHSDGSMANPAVLRPLLRSLTIGLLQAVDHPYQGMMTKSERPVCPAVVNRAAELIEADPQAQWTASEIAVGAGVSIRALQEGFARHLGVSPMRYVRQVRLRRAHDDLVVGDPACDTVASIASRWGFVHLGRFAINYRSRYGVSPSETLHASVRCR